MVGPLSDKVPLSTKETKLSKPWNKINIESFAANFTPISPAELANPNKAARGLEHSICATLDLIAPKKPTKCPNKLSPWFSPKLKIDKLAVRKAERKWRNTKDADDKQLYKTTHRLYSNHIASAKKDYLGNRITQAANSQKELYKIMKEFTNHPSVNNSTLRPRSG